MLEEIRQPSSFLNNSLRGGVNLLLDEQSQQEINSSKNIRTPPRVDMGRSHRKTMVERKTYLENKRTPLRNGKERTFFPSVSGPRPEDEVKPEETLGLAKVQSIKLQNNSRYMEFFKMKFHFTSIVFTGILILRFQKSLRERKLIAMTNQLLDKSNRMKNFKDEEFTLLNIKRIHEELVKKREYDDPYFLELEEKITWGTINKRAVLLDDRDRFYALNRRLFLISKRTSWICSIIAQSKLFQLLMNLLIIVYCVLDVQHIKTKDLYTLKYLKIVFGFEILIKIMGFGLYFSNEGFLKNGWNISDTILLMGTIIIQSFLDYDQIDLIPFKLVNVLKFLPIKSLQSMLQGLFSSFLLVAETFLVVFFLILIFAISGLQIFSGLLKYRCFNEKSGKPLDPTVLCGNNKCPLETACGKLMSFDDIGSNSFDNLYFSLVQMLRVITINDWTDLQAGVQRTFTNYSFPYFVILLILGNYFLLNMILAVLKVKFTQAQKFYIEKLKMPQKRKNIYNLKKMKDTGLFITQKLPPDLYKTMLRQKIIVQDTRATIKDTLSRGRKSKNRIQSENRLSNIIQTNSFVRSSINGVSGEDTTSMNSSPSSKKQARKVSATLRDDSLIKMSELERKMFSRVMKYLSYFQSRFAFFKKAIESYYANDRTVRRAYLVVRVKKEENYDSISEFDVIKRKLKADKITKMVKKSRIIIKKKENKNKMRINLVPYMVKKYIKMNPLSLIDVEIIRKLKQKDMWKLIKQDQIKEKKKRIFRVTRRAESYKFQQLSNFSNFFVQKNAREFMYTQKSLENRNEKEIKVKDHTTKKRWGRARTDKRGEISKVHQSGIDGKEIPMDYEVIRNTILLKFPKKNADFKNYEETYNKIMNSEKTNCKRTKRLWSGSTVIKNYDFTKLMFTLLDLNKIRRGYFYIGFYREFYFLRKKIKELISTSFFKYLFFLFVILNTVILSLEGAINEDTFATANYIYTFIFLFEFILKVLGVGLKKYFRDKVNTVDFCIILYSIFDMTIKLLVKNIENDFHYIRLFRCIKVLRIIRVMRNLQYMNFINFVIANTFSKFIYIAFLLLLLIFAFSIMGMQLFSGSEINSFLEQRSNFNTFLSATLSVFQIITLDDWYKMFALYYGKSNYSVLLGYYFCVIFIGNFIVLNLFIANMLDGFERAHVLLDEDESLFLKEDNNKNLERELMILDLDSPMETGGKDGKGKKNGISILESEESSDSSDEEAFDLNNKTTKSRKSFGMANFDKNSLYIFPQENLFRRFSCAVVRSYIFEKFINLAVVLAIIKLGLDTFEDPSDGLRNTLIALHIILNLIFVIECFLKIVDRGLVISKNSFLREWPNLIDLLTSIIFFLDWVMNKNEITHMKIISLLPKLLRFLYEKEDTKMIIRAMINAFPQIFQVLLVTFFVWLMYGIIGVTLFRQRFGYCDTPDNFKVKVSECPKSKLKRYENHFDNILSSMLTLLVVSTFDNWTEIMTVAVNSDLNGPNQGNNQYSSYIFFTSFIIIGTYLFLNLFIGVIFSNFLKAEKQSSHEFLSEEQVKWTEFLKVMIQSEPFKFYKPRKGYKKFFYNIINSYSFSYGIILCLWLNLIVLSIFDDASGQNFKSILGKILYFLAFIYAFECVLKIMSYGLTPYFSYEWHRFEFAIAGFNIVFVVIENLFEERVKNLDQGPRLLRALGLLRISALIRFVKIYEWLGNFLQNLMFSIPHIMNVLKILLIVYFSFSVIGCHMFRSYKPAEIIDEYLNFSNIFYAIMSLFRCTTGEDWSKIMFEFNDPENCADVNRCASGYAIPFFVVFMLITHFLLLNLIILIIIHQFENYHKSPLNPIDFFKFLNKFRSTWMKYVEEKENKSIHFTKILDFFKYLGPPLGCNKWDNFLEVGKKILNMNIMCDKEGFTQFNELLYGTLKNNYYDRIYGDTNSKSNRYLQKKEEWFYHSLELKKKFMKNSSFSINLFTQITKMHSTSSENKIEIKNKTANPLYFYLIVYMTFNSWRKFSFIYLKMPNDKRRLGGSMVVRINQLKVEDYLSDSSIEENDELLEESELTEEKTEKPGMMVQYLGKNKALSPIPLVEENQNVLNINDTIPGDQNSIIRFSPNVDYLKDLRSEPRELIPNTINENDDDHSI